MIAERRYDRHAGIISPEQQERLAGLRVTVLGNGFLSDMLAIDLLCMGIGKVRHVSNARTFELARVNPGHYEQFYESIGSRLQVQRIVDGSQLVIEACEDLTEKCMIHAALKEKTAQQKGYTVISCESTTNGFSFSDKSRMRDFKRHTGQGVTYSIMAAAMVTNEVRCRYAAQNGETPMGEYEFESATEPYFTQGTVLQVGAGGTGTFAALALALQNANIVIVDHDTVDESNLNRQFLFYDANGKSKAAILAQRLDDIVRRVRPKNKNRISWMYEKVDRAFKLNNGYNCYFSCVDNNVARYYLCKAALETKKPLVNGGVSALSGQAGVAISGLTACLNCQQGNRFAPDEEPAAPRQGGCLGEPSLVVPNQLIGGAMPLVFLLGIKGRGGGSKSTLFYRDGQGIFPHEPQRNCSKGCRMWKEVAVECSLT